MREHIIAITALLLTAATGSTQPHVVSASRALPRPSAGDWSLWRGPDLTGVTTENDWTDEGATEPLWTKELGLGYATVSIAGGRLFTTGYDRERGKDVLYCLDPKTGEVHWTHEVAAEIWNELHEGGTLTTPTVVGGSVFFLNREGYVACLSAEDGEVRWERQLAKDLDLTPPKWGFSASPLPLRGELILNLGRVVSLDPATGEEVWVSDEHLGSAYSTPAPCDLGEHGALAVFNGEGLAVLDLDTGGKIALHPWKTRYDINAATPVVDGNRIFISSGLGRGCALLELGDGGLSVEWESKVMRNKMSGCVLMDDHLYGFDESGLRCVSLSGEQRWHARDVKDGALLGAGDRLLCLDSEGDLVVVAANPDEYEERARIPVLDDEGKQWTTPVLHGGLVYCRSSRGKLVCRDHRPTTGNTAKERDKE